jgi:hypothetical protein
MHLPLSFCRPDAPTPLDSSFVELIMYAHTHTQSTSKLLFKDILSIGL